MPAEYGVYKTPSPDGDKEGDNYHVRLISGGTITTKKFAKEIEVSTSMTKGDVKGLLASISQLLSGYLADGKRVHIEGLGYFQLAITAPAFKDPSKMRGDYIRVKGINFFPEKELMDNFKDINFKKATNKKHSDKLTNKDIENLLSNYFKSHSYMKRADFQYLCGFTKTTALRHIRILVNNNILKANGNRNSPLYEKGEKLK